jgi:hypothetical protein
MIIEAFLHRLACVRLRGSDRWSARCPSHADKSPSLSIREADGKTLLHCFAGCTPEEIVGALGLDLKHLFTDSPTPRGQRPAPKPQKLDLIAVAFRFEMAALDRRIRAERVLKAVANFNSDELSDSQCDRLMKTIARAYEDQDRAEFLETMADDFRVKAFHERTERHAA